MTSESCPRCFAPAGEDGRPDCACSETTAVTRPEPSRDGAPREEAGAPSRSGSPGEAREPEPGDFLEGEGRGLRTRPPAAVPEIPAAVKADGEETGGAGEPPVDGERAVPSAGEGTPAETATVLLDAPTAVLPAGNGNGTPPPVGGPAAPPPASGAPFGGLVTQVPAPAGRRRRPGPVLLTAAAAVVAAAAVAVGTGLLGGGSGDPDPSGRSASDVALPAAPEAGLSASGAARVDRSPSPSADTSASPSATGPSTSASPSASPSGSTVTSPRATASSTAVSPTSSATGAPPGSPSGPQVLKEGDTGPQVVELQKRLGQLFLAYIGPDDGVYDADVADAVARYQRAHGITQDPSGEYGPATRKDLESRTHAP